MKEIVDKEWEGYTFEDLKNQIVVNRVSVDIIKQHITNLGREVVVNPLNNIGGKSHARYFEKVMSALAYLEAAVNIIKRIREILK